MHDRNSQPLISPVPEKTTSTPLITSLKHERAWSGFRIHICYMILTCDVSRDNFIYLHALLHAYYYTKMHEYRVISHYICIR